MTSHDDLGRPLTSWLMEEAAMRAPDDLLPAVLDRAAHTRRRPAWATSERWISMETRAQLVAVPRTAIILAIVGLLVILAAGTFAAGPGGTSLSPTGPAGNGKLAFTQDDDIWVVGPDGGDRHQLTSGDALDGDPVWSRDGTRMAYWTRDQADGPTRLVVMSAEGMDPVTVLQDTSGKTSQSLDWSPDDSQLALALCGNDEPCGDFRIVNADGTGTTSIGDPSFSAWVLRWDPYGERLAFGGTRDGEDRGVYLMSRDGSKVDRISQLDSEQGFDGPEWSPDGTSIATHAGPETADLWVIAADGSHEEMLVKGGILPHWSPDGDLLAYKEEQGDQVAVVPAIGGEPRQLGVSSSHTVGWSPDGTAVAVSRYGQLAIVEATSGDVIVTIPDIPDVPSWQRVAP